jgi:type IV secretory pathway VirB10-like protein
MWEKIVGSDIRVRYSYSGSGWSVQTINPDKTEPKRTVRRSRPFVLVSGAFILLCLAAGFAILSQRAPKPDQSAAGAPSREDIAAPSSVVPPETVGSIPGLVSVPPAPPEPETATEFSTPEPQPMEEAARPSPEVPPAAAVRPSPEAPPAAAVETGGVRSAVPTRRAVQRPQGTRGRVGTIVLASGSGSGAESQSITSIVVEPGQQKRLTLFTELRGLAGETVSHRWRHDGKSMAVIPFKVGGDRWRVHSSKRVTAAMRGSWQVVVTDSRGATLASRSFVVR